MTVPVRCELCPRRCGADRTRGRGRCGGGALPRVARAALHLWEEPCLVGEKGSGAVFFSGCPLGCVFCQNREISAGNFGEEVTVERLGQIFLELQAQGAANINLVTAGHDIPWVTAALDGVAGRLKVPVVWNSGGYETPEAADAVAPYLGVFLPDLKFCSPELSARYCGAPDYFTVATQYILKMFSDRDWTKVYEKGILINGMIVRHLVMPGARRDSMAILDWLAEHIGPEHMLLSLMSQYTPMKDPPEKELGRRVSSWEYGQVLDHAAELGFTGYAQQRSSAKEEYTPPFDLTGVQTAENTGGI